MLVMTPKFPWIVPVVSDVNLEPKVGGFPVWPTATRSLSSSTPPKGCAKRYEAAPFGKMKNLSVLPLTLERSARTPAVSSSRCPRVRNSSCANNPRLRTGCSLCVELMLVA